MTDDTALVVVRVAKPFLHKDRIVHPGESVETNDGHAKQLAQNGLAEVVGSAKSPARAQAKPPKAKPSKAAAGLTSGSRPPRRRKILGA